MGYQSVSECLEQTMAECDLRAAELDDSRRQLAHACRNLSACEKQLAERTAAEADLANRCGTQKTDLDAKQSQLAAANERLQIQVEQNQQSRRQNEQAETEREALRGEVAQLRAQFGPLAELATETGLLRGELAAAQAELVRLRDQPVSAPADPLLQEQLAAAELQRQQLESELDGLRHRGAELSEALAEHKRSAAQEREQWNDELRQLRRAVERRSEVVARRVTPLPDQPPSRPSNDSREENTVVGSVLAQFETLQKNKVRKVANSSG
jgi:chromosome segregation ATPase